MQKNAKDLSGFKVLLLYPNRRSISLIPPSLALFARLLKDQGAQVEVFDTSLYKMDSAESDSDSIEERNLTVHPAKDKAKVKLEDKDVYASLDEAMQRFKPDLLGVTVTDSTILLALKLLKVIRRHKVLTILGGIFATFAPERAIGYPEIDIACVGEGELSLVELCRRLKGKMDYSDIPNLWIKNRDGSIIKNDIGPAIDINALPLLDLSVFDERRLSRMMGGKMYRMLPVETHRGCPYFCTYCGSPTQNERYARETGTKFFRKKSIALVKKELLYYKNEWKAEYLFFWADTLLSYTDKELAEFCDMYAEVKLPFYCQARPENVTDFRIKRLKEVGLDRLGVGIEHGNEKYRKEVLKRYYSNAQAIKSMRALQDNGVSFSLNNIIGLPDETPELAMDTVELNRQIGGFTDTSCSIFQPYYGTPLREVCIRKGYIAADLLCPHNAEGSLLDMPSFPKDRIAGLQRTFNMYVRFPKNRWNEIRSAERLTPEGDAAWERLREELVRTCFE